MTPEKLAALADCPFCGEPGYVREIDYGPAAFRVECSEGCCAMEVWNEDQASAITAWNIRTMPQGYAAGVEAAAKALQATVSRYKQEKPAPTSDEKYNLVVEAAMAAIEELEENGLAAIRALSSADAVVEEWVLVPKEPTMEMQEAAEISDREYTKRVFGDIATVRQGPYDTYVTMISATPPAVRGK